MIIKSIIILFLLTILFQLGRGLFFLMRDQGQSPRMVQALSWRISLSLILFALLIVACAFGWIKPHAPW